MPSADKMGDAKIRTRKIGATNLIIITKSFSLPNSSPLSFISSVTVLVFTTQPIRIQVRKATIGIIILLET